MKKFFNGSKKKTKSTAGFSISVDSDTHISNIEAAKKVQVSRSTEQPRNSLLTDANNKTLVHSASHCTLKPTTPRQQVMTKRLHRSTSSPPALVMPRPRYAEPPTRAILRSYELEKTQLDPDTAIQQLLTPLSQAETQTQNTPLPEYVEDDKLHMISMAPLNNQHDRKILPMRAATSTKPRKVSPITALPPQYDGNPIPAIRNEKSLDGSDPHEPMNSMTGSDDSNRVYDTALESPTISTSTLMDYVSLTNMTTGIGTRQPQSQRHPSPISFSSTHGVTSSLPLSPPPAASGPSVTLAPIGQTSQHQHTPGRHQPSTDWLNNTDTIKTAHPTPPAKNGNEPGLLNHTTRQMQDTDYVKSLQQQVMFMQQQRIMDRVEYERMEQLHKERTNWMQAEIDRTQTKLLELEALKQERTLQHDGSLSPSIKDQYDDDWRWQQQQQQRPPDFYKQQFSDNLSHLDEIPDSPEFRSLYQEKLRSSSSSTSSASQLKKSRSGNSIPRLSRSSSKTTTGGRSSSDSLSYRANQRRIQPPPPPPLHQRHILAPMNDYSGSYTSDEQQPPPPPSVFSSANEHPTQTNRRRSGSLSRRNSQSHQHEYQSLSSQHGERQDMYSPKLRSVRLTTSRPRRARSKSIDMQSPSPIEVDQDHPIDYYDSLSSICPPSRPRSVDNRCRHQRIHSVEQPHPFFYHDSPYFQQPDVIDCDSDDDLYRIDRYRTRPLRLDGFPLRHSRQQRMQYPPLGCSPKLTNIPSFPSPMSCYGAHQTFRPPPRMDRFPGPLASPNYYPPPAWHQQQQILSGMLPSTDDTIYWKYSSALADMGQPFPPFNEHSLLQANIPQLWMDDATRPPPY
ncbi:hypothetical protein BCR42DRAFT_453607 [Absidia repens]|uniref:Uncharacterized protein n=1 Tax=Absidia repens TaxID=90262 RepID=A0A1X2I9G3_9FUNG|nr:hypothetical protein BCR42DRAFT_453607 [Absidia repens]